MSNTPLILIIIPSDCPEFVWACKSSTIVLIDLGGARVRVRRVVALWVVLSVWRERMRIASHAANGSLSAVSPLVSCAEFAKASISYKHLLSRPTRRYHGYQEIVILVSE